MARATIDKPSGIARVLPILSWAPEYQRMWLRPDVIAAGEDVNPRRQNLVRGGGGQTTAMRHVLPVGHHDVNVELVFQARQKLFNGLPARFANNVADG